MTANPACCTSNSTIEDAAKLMVKYNCGEIPVIQSEKDRQVVGVITDRDICCRTIGKSLNPMSMTVGAVMSSPVVTISDTGSLTECALVMEKNQIRRIPVVNQNEEICGIVALADLVEVKKSLAGEVIREISKPRGASLGSSEY